VNRKLLLIAYQMLAYLHHNREYDFTFSTAVQLPLSDCIFILNNRNFMLVIFNEILIRLFFDVIIQIMGSELLFSEYNLH
jgi:hypothetical protein